MKDSNNQSKTPMIKCPECGSLVRFDHLERHRLLEHRVETEISLPSRAHRKNLTGSSDQRTNTSGQSKKNFKSLKRHCPYCHSRITWEEWPSHKEECVARPSNRPDSSIGSLSSTQKSTPKSSDTDLEKAGTQKPERICPFCRKQLKFEEYREHVKGCYGLQKRRSSNLAKTNTKRNRPTALQQQKYISDKHGVVQDYGSWLKNQKIVESNPVSYSDNNINQRKRKK